MFSLDFMIKPINFSGQDMTYKIQRVRFKFLNTVYYHTFIEGKFDALDCCVLLKNTIEINFL